MGNTQRRAALASLRATAVPSALPATTYPGDEKNAPGERARQALCRSTWLPADDAQPVGLGTLLGPPWCSSASSGQPPVSSP